MSTAPLFGCRSLWDVQGFSNKKPSAGLNAYRMQIQRRSLIDRPIARHVKHKRRCNALIRNVYHYQNNLPSVELCWIILRRILPTLVVPESPVVTLFPKCDCSLAALRRIRWLENLMSNEMKSGNMNEHGGSGKNDPNRTTDAPKSGQQSQGTAPRTGKSATQQGGSDHKSGQQLQGGSQKDKRRNETR